MKKGLLPFSKILFLFFMVISSDAIAQWQSIGPEGGTVGRLAISGDKIFAAAFYGGLFLSTNYGLSWEPACNDFTDTYVSSMIFEDSIIYIGTFNDGIFKSSIKGSVWQPINKNLTSSYVNCLLMTENYMFAGTSFGGIFKSSNKGQEWQENNSGIKNKDVNCIIEKNNVLFAGTLGGGIYKSADEGISWAEVDSSMAKLKVTCMAANDSILIAGTERDGTYISTDNGIKWDKIKTDLPGNSIFNIIINNNNIYSFSYWNGIYQSKDNGATWAKMNELTNNLKFKCFEFAGDSMIGGTYGNGIYISVDSGLNWQSSNTGLHNLVISYMGIFDDKIFAGDDNGHIFYTSGGGWIEFDDSLAKPVDISIVGNYIFTWNKDGEIYLSTDSLASWKLINNDIKNKNILSLAVKDSLIFAATWGNGVYFSSDNGTTWNQSGNGINEKYIKKILVKGNTIFALAGDTYSSTDNGKNWEKASEYGFDNLFVNGNDIYGGWGGEILRSTDNCRTWEYLNRGLTDSEVNCIAFSGENIFAGNASGEVFLSTNKGVSWNIVNAGQPVTPILNLIVKDGFLYTGTMGRSVYKAKIDELVKSVQKYEVIASGKKRICYRDEVGIGVESINYGNWPYSYKWSPATGLSSATDSIVIASPSVTTKYMLVVTDNLSNKDTVFVSVNVYSNPIPYAKDTTVEKGSLAKLTAISPQGSTFRWYDSYIGGNLVFTGNQLTITALNDTSFYLEAQSNFTGCISEFRKRVKLKVLPLDVDEDIYNNNNFEYPKIKSIIPLPAQDYVKVEIESTADTEIELTLYNLLGLEVQSLRTGILSGTNIISLDFNGIHTAGPYVLKLKSSFGQDSKMLILK